MNNNAKLMRYFQTKFDNGSNHFEIMEGIRGDSELFSIAKSYCEGCLRCFSRYDPGMGENEKTSFKQAAKDQEYTPAVQFIGLHEKPDLMPLNKLCFGASKMQGDYKKFKLPEESKLRA